MSRYLKACRLFVFAAVAAAFGQSSVPALAETQQSLAGIMHLELDDSAQKVLTGSDAGSYPYLTTYISAKGTYAAIGNGTDRGCIAWAQAGKVSARSVRFGLPATERTIKTAYPRICQPFTISLEADGSVRLAANNPYSRKGPLADIAQPMNYSRKTTVLEHVQLTAIDWSADLYNTFKLQDVRLGPVPAMKSALASSAEVEVGPLINNHYGAKIRVVVTNSPNDIQNSRTVLGVALDGTRMGWPWNALFSAQYTERFPSKITTDAFDEQLSLRYGTPSFVEKKQIASARTHFWVFDMNGNKLNADASNEAPCLGLRRIWEPQLPMASHKTDFGPWNCALILRVTDSGGIRSQLSGYSAELLSGYAAGLNHFRWRLDEVERAKAQMDSIQTNEVKL